MKKILIAAVIFMGMTQMSFATVANTNKHIASSERRIGPAQTTPETKKTKKTTAKAMKSDSTHKATAKAAHKKKS